MHDGRCYSSDGRACRVVWRRHVSYWWRLLREAFYSWRSELPPRLIDDPAIVADGVSMSSSSLSDSDDDPGLRSMWDHFLGPFDDLEDGSSISSSSLSHQDDDQNTGSIEEAAGAGGPIGDS